MKVISKPLFLLSIIITLWIGLSTTLFATNGPYASEINKSVQAFMVKNHVPGVAVLMYVDGKPYAYYYGLANREKNRPVTEKTIFELGTLSDVMTGLIFAERIDYAKMSLADPVSKFVDRLPNHFSSINMQNLATYTAGLPANDASANFSSNGLLNYFAKNGKSASPNRQWLESPAHMGLMGYALESESNKPLNKIYHDRVGEMLGTLSIELTVPKQHEMDCAQGYDPSGQPIKPNRLGLFPAATGVKMSALDMQRFLSAAIGVSETPVTILYPMRMMEVAYVRLPTFYQGLAWQIHPLNQLKLDELVNHPEVTGVSAQRVLEIYDKPLYRGDMMIDKRGDIPGFRSYMAFIPDKLSGVVILANQSVDDAAIMSLGRSILFQTTGLYSKQLAMLTTAAAATRPSV